MLKYFRTAALCAAAGLISLFISCSDNPIFANIQREDLLDDGSMENEITLLAFDKLHNSSTGDYYITAGKRVWYELVDQTSDFKKMTQPPSPFNGELSGCSSLIVHNGSTGEFILGSFYETTREGQVALFMSTDPDEGTWTQVTNSLAVAEEVANESNIYYYRYNLLKTSQVSFIQKLQYKTIDNNDSKLAGSQLFVLPSGTDLTDLTSLDEIQLNIGSHKGEILDAVYDGSRYYFILNDYTDYESGHPTGYLLEWDGSSTTTVTNQSLTNGQQFTALSYISSTGKIAGEDLYVFSTSVPGSDTNYIYVSLDASTWISKKTKYLVSHFLDISPLTRTFSTPEDLILLSTKGFTSSGTSVDGSGYKEMDITDLTTSAEDSLYEITLQGNTFSDKNNYDSTGDNLQETTIQFSYIDTEETGEYPIWAITFNKGLWKNTVSEGVREWLWE